MLIVGQFPCMSFFKVWMCITGADRQLHHNPNMYKQLVTANHNHDLIETIQMGKYLIISSKGRITKTSLYNVDPLKPHFCIVKLGFTGVYIVFLISAQKHRLWVLVRTASAMRF